MRGKLHHRLHLLRAAFAFCAMALPFGALAAPPAGCPGGAAKLVVPFPAGAAPDVIARLVGNALAQHWKSGLVVDNRPGAGGIPGMAALQRAGNDGCTLGFLPAAVVTLTPHLFKNPQFDLDRDFQPVALIGISPLMVVVKGDSPLRSLADLARAAKERGTKYNFAAAQLNSLPHLTGEMLSQRQALQLFTVPYSGAPAAISAVLAGDTDLTIDGVPGVLQHVRSGKLRALAVTSEERLPGFDDIPAVAEAAPGFESVGWFALYAPKGVPRAQVESVAADVQAVMAQPALDARLQEMGFYRRALGPGATREFVDAQRRLFKKVVESLGLQPQ